MSHENPDRGQDGGEMSFEPVPDTEPAGQGAKNPEGHESESKRKPLPPATLVPVPWKDLIPDIPPLSRDELKDLASRAKPLANLDLNPIIGRKAVNWPPSESDLGGSGGLVGSIDTRFLDDIFPPTAYRTSRVMGTGILQFVCEGLSTCTNMTEVLRARLERADGLLAFQLDERRVIGKGGFGAIMVGMGAFYRPRPGHDDDEFLIKNQPAVVKALFQHKGDPRSYVIISDDGQEREAVRRTFREPLEFTLLTALRHPFLVHMYDYTRTPPPVGSYLAVLEYLSGGDMWTYHTRYAHYKRELHHNPASWRLRTPSSYGSIEEVTLRGLVREVCMALQYLHHHGVAHLDLKGNNVLLDRHGTAILCDLGLSTPHLNWTGLTAVPADRRVAIRLKGGHGEGVIDYMAPEQFAVGVQVQSRDEWHRLAMEAAYDPAKSDMWSLGVLTFVSRTQLLPFPSHPDLVWYEARQRALEERQLPPNKSHWAFSMYWMPSGGVRLSSELADFLAHLMEPDAERRMSATEALCSPWLTLVADPLGRSLYHSDQTPAPVPDDSLRSNVDSTNCLIQ